MVLVLVFGLECLVLVLGLEGQVLVNITLILIHLAFLILRSVNVTAYGPYGLGYELYGIGETCILLGYATLAHKYSCELLVELCVVLVCLRLVR